MVLMRSKVSRSWRLSTTEMMLSTKPSRPTRVLIEEMVGAAAGRRLGGSSQVCSRVNGMGSQQSKVKFKMWNFRSGISNLKFKKLLVAFHLDHARYFFV